MAKREQKQKTQIVAFKVEAELAEFLDKLPNKSEFIRKAVLAQFGMTCPLCDGSGVVPRGIHEHFSPIIAERNVRPCEKCRASVSVPLAADATSSTDRRRIEQFMHGGPLFCVKCYPTITSCDDCGWHVASEKMIDHFKKAHAS
jgi:hypothetical protein